MDVNKLIKENRLLKNEVEKLKKLIEKMNQSCDTKEFWNERKNKQNRLQRLRLENADPTGWGKYTESHWFRVLNGEILEYWPRLGKWQYKNKTYYGEKKLRRFIKELEIPT